MNMKTDKIKKKYKVIMTGIFSFLFTLIFLCITDFPLYEVPSAMKSVINYPSILYKFKRHRILENDSITFHRLMKGYPYFRKVEYELDNGFQKENVAYRCKDTMSNHLRVYLKINIPKYNEAMEKQGSKYMICEDIKEATIELIYDVTDKNNAPLFCGATTVFEGKDETKKKGYGYHDTQNNSRSSIMKASFFEYLQEKKPLDLIYKGIQYDDKYMSMSVINKLSEQHFGIEKDSCPFFR